MSQGNDVFYAKSRTIHNQVNRVVTRFTPFVGAGTLIWYPIASIRLNPDFQQVDARITLLSVGANSGLLFYLGFFRNDPNNSLINGTDKAVWTDYSPTGRTQFDISRDNTNTITNDQNQLLWVIASDKFTNSEDILTAPLGKNANGDPLELILAGYTTVENENFYGSLNYCEVF